MKWVVATMNVSSITRTVRTVRSMSRLFVAVSTATLLFLVATGLIGLAQQKWPVSSASSMRGAVAALSSSFFLDMLAMELPHLRGEARAFTFSPKNTASFLIRSMTGIHPGDPRSFLASELPGMRGDSSAVLYSGKATRDTDYPADFTPPPDALRQAPGSGEAEMKPQPVPDPGSSANAGTQPLQETPPAGTPSTGSPSPGTSSASPKEPRILIYHSHNRESFLPELKSKGVTSPDLAYDADINVTLVGKRLKEKIEALGIPTLQSVTDYPSTVKNFNYAKSYAYSAATVKAAMAEHRQLGMIFDVHRDSLSRDKTTVRLNGKDYAQVYFVVGKKNPNWEKNSDFASRIHALLEQKYPGISRGVFGKSSHGNGEYNQSLSPNSILLEIGGPYNTLEEMYRTADVLAELIAELYWNAEKANAPAP